MFLHDRTLKRFNQHKKPNFFSRKVSLDEPIEPRGRTVYVPFLFGLWCPRPFWLRLPRTWRLRVSTRTCLWWKLSCGRFWGACLWAWVFSRSEWICSCQRQRLLHSRENFSANNKKPFKISVLFESTYQRSVKAKSYGKKRLKLLTKIVIENKEFLK